MITFSLTLRGVGSGARCAIPRQILDAADDKAQNKINKRFQQRIQFLFLPPSAILSTSRYAGLALGIRFVVMQ